MWFWVEGVKKGRESGYAWADSGRMEGNGFKLKEERFRLDAGKKVFI